MTKSRHRQERPIDSARKEAQGLLDNLRIHKAPVPVARIARAVGATVRYYPLDEELSGMIFIKDSQPIIGVNALHHPNRQRFTIAHEIGHLMLHRRLIEKQVHVDKTFPVMVHRDTRSTQGTDLIEIQANQFAAALLMPESLLRSVIGQEEYDIDDERPIDELARKLRVSRQALEFRIRNLN